MALDIAKAKPMVLAAGVSQALITTAAGLIVGIPAMMAYAYFRGRASKLISGPGGRVRRPADRPGARDAIA